MSAPAPVFELYVAGDGPNSRAARGNLIAWCQTAFDPLPTVTVIDVLTDPGRAVAEGVLLTPQLLVRTSRGVRRVIGTLATADTTLPGLVFEPEAPAP